MEPVQTVRAAQSEVVVTGPADCKCSQLPGSAPGFSCYADGATSTTDRAGPPDLG